ncbi:MAG TPA: hypothetical protein VF119_08235 [Candidatus Limnocylindrales bacterium]
MARRSILSALAATLGLAVVVLLAPRPAVACSCIATQPMSVYADEAETAIFTGITAARDGRGYPVTVTRWFKGDGAAPTVWLAPSAFDGNDASCGLEPLDVAVEWIFVAYRIPDAGELIVNLCAPHARASDPEGQAMYADAIRTFGDPGALRPTLPPTGSGDATATDDGLSQVLPAIGATVAAGLVMILGVYAITTWWRRRRGDLEA